MKRYYRLGLSSEPKIIGVRNGVHQGEIKWERFANNGMERIISDYFSLEKYQNNIAAIEPIDFEIEHVEAYKLAKMTDIFGYFPKLWGIEYFISDKFKKLLSLFNLPIHSYVPITIVHNSENYSYWGLYIPVSYREDAFNFEKSIFYDFDAKYVGKREYINMKNLNDYKAVKFIKPEQIAFNSKFDKALDLFLFLFGGGGYYISEKLRSAIVDGGITGVNIREPKEPTLYFNE
jgi:hypothetical protein